MITTECSEFRLFIETLRRLGIDHQVNWCPTKRDWQESIVASGFNLTALACYVVEVGAQQFLFSNGQPHWDENEVGHGPSGVLLLSRNKNTGEIAQRRYFNPQTGAQEEGVGLQAMQKQYQFETPGSEDSQRRRSTTTELKAPKGKTRVVGVDLFDHDDYLVDDYDDQDEAFRIADEHNTKRSDRMDDVYYVYDDVGTYIRGNEAVNQKVSP